MYKLYIRGQEPRILNDCEAAAIEKEWGGTSTPFGDSLIRVLNSDELRVLNTLPDMAAIDTANARVKQG